MLQPYSITDDQGIATFTADNQAIYKAFFLQPSFSGEPQLEGFIVDFSFERDSANCPDATRKAKDGTYKKQLGRNDPRIALTLQRVVDSFFENNPLHVVYFTCYSEDNKHQGRLHLFNEWHAAHADRFTKIPFCIAGGLIAEEPVADIIGGAVFLTDHPLHELITSFVTSEVIVYNSIKQT